VLAAPPDQVSSEGAERPGVTRAAHTCVAFGISFWVGSNIQGRDALHKVRVITCDTSALGGEIIATGQGTRNHNKS
jgi:hypothetical protein